MTTLAVDAVDPETGDEWGETLEVPDIPQSRRHRTAHIGTITWERTPPEVDVPDEPYESHVYMTEDGAFGRLNGWSMAASVGPSGNRGWGYILVNEYYRDHWAFSLLHELGHNAGYHHDAGGVMAPDRPDLGREGYIHPTTQTIVECCAHFEYIDWSRIGRAMRCMRREADRWWGRNGSNGDYLYAVRQWRDATGASVYAHDSLSTVMERGMHQYPWSRYDDHFTNADRRFWSGGYYRGGSDWGNHRWNLFDPPAWDPV